MSSKRNLHAPNLLIPLKFRSGCDPHSGKESVRLLQVSKKTQQIVASFREPLTDFGQIGADFRWYALVTHKAHREPTLYEDAPITGNY